MKREPDLDPVTDAATSTFGISELAENFNITSRTLRFYEDKGLLTPHREGKTRIYNARDRARLQLILRGKRLGFSLAEISAWLDLYALENGQQRQYEVLLIESQKRIAELEQKLSDLKDTLRELKDIENVALRHLGTNGAAPPDRQSSIPDQPLHCVAGNPAVGQEG